MKTCSKCKIEQPRNNFSNRKLSKDGKVSWCNSCMREYREQQNIIPTVFVESKVCNRCKQELPRTRFTKNTGSPDGLYSLCKDCRGVGAKKYRAKNRERILEKQREYAIDPEFKEKAKLWRAKNKERLDTRLKKWRKENPERLREIDNNSRNKNKEKVQARLRRTAKNPVTFETYNRQLTPDERCFDSDGKLGVKCFYCNKEYIPTLAEVSSRIFALNNLKQGERHIYCSPNCKISCPTYNKRTLPGKHGKSGTSREMQADFRKQILERDNWTCQICGAADKPLHAHHMTAYRTDYDSMHESNGITLCKDCHKRAHKQEGCSSQAIASQCL